MTEFYNDAQRLFLILNQALSADETTKTKEVWKSVLHTADDIELAIALGDLVKLSQEVRKSIQTLPHAEAEAHLKHFVTIEKILVWHPNDKWSNVANQLKRGAMATLEVYASSSSSKAQEYVVSQDTLDELQREVEDFLDDIVQSDISEGLKEVLY